MTHVAFLGLGHMGTPMAVNLARAGHQLVGFDPSGEARETARVRGLRVADHLAGALARAEVVVTMLPSGKHVVGAYDGPQGLIELARPDTLFIDSSTISVDDARGAHRLAVSAGHRQIDAPVSGGVVGAEAGTLAFMVGGEDDSFQTALPLLQAMGKRIVHCGASGLGQAAKICNNLILGISMVAVSEAFVLGEELGLTHEALFDVASNASGQCWALTTNCPVPGPVPSSPANHGFDPGFAGALMLKDMGLAMEAIRSTGVRAEVGPLVHDLYSRFVESGRGDRDFSAIINQIRDVSATT